MEVARLRAHGHTYREIEARTGLSRSTVGYLEKQPDVREEIRHERRREQDRIRKAESRERARRAALAFHKRLVSEETETPSEQTEASRRRRGGSFGEFLDRKDRERELRARDAARGRSWDGMVPAIWPGASGSYDPDDQEDVDRMVDLVAWACPDLDPDRIRDKLVRANTGTQDAVVFNGAAARGRERSTSG